MAETSDGGYIVGGTFTSDSITVGDKTFENKWQNANRTDGIVIKYNLEGKVQWAVSEGDANYDYIYSVVGTNDGKAIIVLSNNDKGTIINMVKVVKKYGKQK